MDFLNPFENEMERLWFVFCKIHFDSWIEKQIKEEELLLKSYRNHVVGNNDWFMLHQIHKSRLELLLQAKRI